MAETTADARLWDPDTFAAGVPHATFDRLRASSGLYWQDEPDGPGFWALTRHADVRLANRDNVTFSSNRGGYLMEDPPPEHLAMLRTQMIGMDPPRHTRYRLLVNKGFTPRQVDRREGHIRELARGIVEDIAGRSEVDFVSAVAAELPLLVICELVGVPTEDRSKVYDWSNRLIGFDDPDFRTSAQDGMEAAAEMYEYAHDLGAARRDDPREDIVSALVHAEIDGERLSEPEFDLFFLLLMVAGNETTRNAISHGMKALVENPDQMRRLSQDLSLARSATEEILRWATPVMYFRRTATTDATIAGTGIRKGDKITMWYSSANRDESMFDDPHRFDICRSPNDHIAFGGGGAHYCLGANLARLEIRVMLEEIFSRLADFEFTERPTQLRSNFINGIKSMPVRFSIRT